MAYRPVGSHEEYLKILEQYRDYRQGSVHTLTLAEKIDFFDGIHTNHVLMFDENGNDTIGTLWDLNEFPCAANPYGKELSAHLLIECNQKCNHLSTACFF